jgi:hypothetical protein
LHLLLLLHSHGCGAEHLRQKAMGDDGKQGQGSTGGQQVTQCKFTVWDVQGCNIVPLDNHATIRQGSPESKGWSLHFNTSLYMLVYCSHHPTAKPLTLEAETNMVHVLGLGRLTQGSKVSQDESSCMMIILDESF